MVLLVTTSTIVAALQALSPASREKLGLPQTTPEIGSPISHEQVIALGRAHNESDDERAHGNKSAQHEYTLNSLLWGTRVYIPPAPPKPEPSPEYLALKARLLALAEEQAYNQLLAPSSTHSSTLYKPSPIFANDTINNDINNIEDEHDSISPSLVINIFMSVLLCGFATFWALKNFQTPSFLGSVLVSTTTTTTTNRTATSSTTTTTAGGKDPVFVLISMFVGILVGVAETVVYAAYLRKVRQAKEVERNIKEKKEIAEEDETVTEQHAADDDDDAKEEVKIWGKGVNGGVRRRVRERWENENDY